MCLTLTEDSTRLRKNYRRRKKPIIVYKVLEKCEDDVYAPYRGDLYPKEGSIISNRTSTNIQDEERHFGFVIMGFHFFLNKEDARKDILDWDKIKPLKALRLVIYKAEVDPKDVVAVGEFERQLLTLVATKATMIGEVKEDDE
jgi:hypothetical protein